MYRTRRTPMTAEHWLQLARELKGMTLHPTTVRSAKRKTNSWGGMDVHVKRPRTRYMPRTIGAKRTANSWGGLTVSSKKPRTRYMPRTTGAKRTTNSRGGLNVPPKRHLLSWT